MFNHPLEPIFHPRAVALVGVSSNPSAGWGGGGFHQAILEMGFNPEAVYPVNPKMEEISGLKCYPTLLDTPDPVDHVISLVPAPVVPSLIDQCIAKRVRCLHLFTAGFSETGDERMAAIEQETVAKLLAAGIRVIGPNCMGLYVPESGLAFSRGFPREPGNVFLLSQSGANASQIISSLARRGVRFSKAVSFGNGADLKAHDFFDYAASDPQTEVVIAYIEGIQDGRAMLETVKRCARQKPTIILKGGLSAAGARAANSHTASLAGSRQIFEALCRQAGAMRAETMNDLLDLTVAITTSAKDVRGSGVALVGGPGGFAVLSSDAIAAEGLDIPPMPEAAKRGLRQFIPVAGTSVNNPIDAHLRTRQQFEDGMRIIAGAEGIDMVLSTSFGPGPGAWIGENEPEQAAGEGSGNRVEQDAASAVDLLVNLQDETKVPFVVVQRDSGFEGVRGLAHQQAAYQRGIAVFPDVPRAARSVRLILEWRTRREGLPDIF
jgi:acyl-CoA synthetase (NDP forming)